MRDPPASATFHRYVHSKGWSHQVNENTAEAFLQLYCCWEAWATALGLLPPPMQFCFAVKRLPEHVYPVLAQMPLQGPALSVLHNWTVLISEALRAEGGPRLHLLLADDGHIRLVGDIEKRMPPWDATGLDKYVAELEANGMPLPEPRPPPPWRKDSARAFVLEVVKSSQWSLDWVLSASGASMMKDQVEAWLRGWRHETWDLTAAQTLVAGCWAVDAEVNGTEWRVTPLTAVQQLRRKRPIWEVLSREHGPKRTTEFVMPWDLSTDP